MSLFMPFSICAIYCTLSSLAPTLAAAGDKILHGFYKTDTLDLTLTCYDGIGQECVKYENE